MKINPYCAIQLDVGRWAVGCIAGTEAGSDPVLTIERVFHLGSCPTFHGARQAARDQNAAYREQFPDKAQPSTERPADRNELLADLAFLYSLASRADEFAPECGWLSSDETIWLESIRDLLRQECVEIPNDG